MKVASSARHQAGFTLLEVLLVAMLMGLVATAVTLSMGAPGSELDKQARCRRPCKQAQEYSVMDGCLGLRVEENGWQLRPGIPRIAARTDR
jgi:general secretion pathway protein H